MAKRYAKFTSAYEGSSVPFLLAEVITNGSGDMVDLVCRYANEAASALLGYAQEELSGLRFTKKLSPDRLETFRPLSTVAFSGSSVSFDYTTVLERELTISCYQLRYGLCACILSDRQGAARPALTAAELTVQSLPGGVAVLELGRQGLRLLSCGAQLYALLGYSERDFMNRFFANPTGLLAPEERSEALQILLDAVHESRDLDREVALLCADGTSRWFSLRTKYISNKDGTAVLSIVLLDMHDRRQEQEALLKEQTALRELQGQFDCLFDIPSSGYCLFHRNTGEEDFQLQRVSQGFAQILGYPVAEVFKRLSADRFWRVYVDDRATLKWAYEESLKSRQPLKQTFRVQRKDGAVLWLSAVTSLRQCSAGGWDCCAVFLDVTARQEAENELRFRSELSELLLSRPNSVSIDYDPQADSARFELFDAGGSRASHIVPDYRKNMSASTTIHPDDRKAVAAELRKACARPGRGSISYRGSYAGQSFRWYEAVFMSLSDLGGNVSRIVVKCEDVTAQKSAEAAFAKKAARWEQYGGALAAVRLDLTDDRLLNAKAGTPYLLRALFGNTASECMDSLSQALAKKQDSPAFSAVFSREVLLDAFQRGQAQFGPEFRFMVEENHALWVRFELDLAENPVNRHLECGCRIVDVDERHRRDAVLHALAGQSFVFVMTVDTLTRHFRLYDKSGSVPQTVGTDFYRAALEQIDTRVAAENRKAMRNAILLPGIVRHLKKTPVYGFSVAASVSGSSRHLWICFTRLDETTLLLTGTDMSTFVEEHQAQQSRLSAALSAAEGVGENQLHFLSRLADEVRSPLEAIRASVQSADGSASKSSQETVLQNVQYLQLLTDDLLDITQMEQRRFRLQLETFSLQSVLDRAGALPLLAQKQIIYTVSASPAALKHYTGDGESLLKILKNLLANAARFTPQGGRVSLSVQQTNTAENLKALEFQVCDTGCGIAPDLLPQLFEPFAHTGSADQNSTGLGLAISQGLARAMGGTLTVSSIPGVGSRFTLTVPLRVCPGNSAQPYLSGKRILTALPDQSEVLEALQAAGAAVENVSDGLQALQRFVGGENGFYSAAVLAGGLSVMDGAHTVAVIRGWNRPDAKSLPIFVLGGQESGDFHSLPECPDGEVLLRAVFDAVQA